jgi:nitrogen fixation NifU-like protein
MSDLRDLYQEVILDHNREPRNFGRPPHANCEARGDNPLCGDKVTVYLALEDGVVKDVGFEGRGCAISMASASLMTEMVKGKTAAEAQALFRRFQAAMTGQDEAVGGDEDLDKLAVLSGVREYPMRVKCATLSWHTLAAAMANGNGATVSTETE